MLESDSSSSGISPAIRYSSFAQAPRSRVLQRSEQNGRNFEAGTHATGAPQRGQATVFVVIVDSEQVGALDRGDFAMPPFDRPRMSGFSETCANLSSADQ
jgi:hypothetical protein